MIATKTLPSVAGVTFRPYRGESDLPAMLEVLQSSKDADGLDQAASLDMLRLAYLAAANFDPPRDVLVAEAGQRLAAYGRTFWQKEDGAEVYQYWIVSFVRPDWRRHGIGTALLGWLEQCALAVAAQRGHAATALAYWQVMAYDCETAKAALLERAGYAPARYFYDMVRPNLDDIPDAPMPAGLEIRAVQPEHLRAIWDANEEAFRDHWAEPERQPQDYERWLANDECQPDIWKVAWDTARGEVAGMVLGFIHPEENARFHRQRGWTENICVRRPWRRRGLASALIAASLRELKARGMSEAALGVDADSLTGALGVYERMGFQVTRRETLYRKPIWQAEQRGHAGELETMR
ncbi:MAG: GNAT family N-acetyltransferase [Anaerolineales bacterium]|nr:GNAT family N-acetyltransferase [Anaerolineales bacterium]